MSDHWVGVDLDGTLAEYHDWQGPDHIGKPIVPMVNRIKRWLDEGRDIRIFTARVAKEGMEAESARAAIHEWCIGIFGKILPVTCRKDYLMIELWDDRCVQVTTNVGERINRGIEALEAIAEIDELVEANDGAFGIHAFRRCQEIARSTLKKCGLYNSDD
jgi:hypothetical protein